METPHMGEEEPVETRRVVIQYTINVPAGPADHSYTDPRVVAALAAEMVRKSMGQNRPL